MKGVFGPHKQPWPPHDARVKSEVAFLLCNGSNLEINIKLFVHLWPKSPWVYLETKFKGWHSDANQFFVKNIFAFASSLILVPVAHPYIYCGQAKRLISFPACSEYLEVLKYLSHRNTTKSMSTSATPVFIWWSWLLLFSTNYRECYTCTNKT